ncbi:MAG: phenylalanine--tRNA ligase subunit beta, partial [Clostridia bacterium]|nr:phenylalanine--tRNA ligase subunit beta [Clostridia bacterium]
MKVPFSWLKDYVDIDCSAEELEEKLFSCGFEVEEKIYRAKNIDKIVTCKILSIDKHPNADKLSVTQVDAGKYGKLQIITNAKNISVGDIVPVAVDGATLNNNERIFNGEIRGVKSFGMFCSGEELGINDDWYEGASFNGILILKENYPLGEEVKKLLEIEDVIFDINVTANRPDCQSILGIAREVSAVLNKPLKMPDFSFNTDKNISTIKTVKVENNAFDLCQRYKSHLVTDVVLAPSPLWLKRRLFSMGLRSINNIVDITNFVLLEIGQPMHAFDLSDLDGNKINIRRANENEKIITLDEKEFKLNSNNLVICDANKPVALAGVMGGLNSEIKDSTTNVLFESAKFSRDNIRKTSRALGQRSDSSSRYEKGVDYLSVENGMNRALNLIDKLGCGKIACDEYDLIDKPLSNKVIKTTISKINGVLGIDISASFIEDILTRLNFGVKIDKDNIEVTVPLYRDDMEDYPDIAEEIIREYGYDHISSTLLKTSSITNGGRNDEQKSIEQLKNLLVGYGFNEIITYSFVSEKDFENFGIDNTNVIKILNPISEDMAVMRKSLIPSIVKTVAYNIKRKNFSARFFELAKIYNAENIPLTKLPVEKTNLSFAIFGEDEDFFTAKGVVEGVLDTFCFGENIKYVKSNKKYLHPTRSADVFVGDKYICSFGQLNPELAEKFDIDKPVYIGEILYDETKPNVKEKLRLKAISKLQTVARELA